ncbi:MAG: hypothetical protein WA154_12880 [Moraxellaceae bacterium]
MTFAFMTFTVLPRIREVLTQVDHPEFTYVIECHEEEMFLRVCPKEGTCNVSRQELNWKGRHWRLSQWMTDGEIAQTAFMATLAAIEHETRERFTYKGVSVFDPHYDIDALVALRGSPGGGLKERT